MMSDERQMLEGLFERIRGAGAGGRDADAEAFIAGAVKAQPYAPYIMAQTILVQQQTLDAAGARMQELEARVKSLEAAAAQPQAPTSFLGNLGKSIFASPAPAPSAVPRSAPSAPAYAPPPPQAGPWGQQAAPQQQQPQAFGGAAPMMGGGGGFLKGALGAAAGVAGGMLIANSLSGMLGGHNSHGFGGQQGQDGHGNTVVNNYYGDQSAADAAQDAAQDASDNDQTSFHSNTQEASYDDSSASFGGHSDSEDV